MLIERNESKDIDKRIKKEIKKISSTLDLLKEKLNQIERFGEEEILDELTPSYKFYLIILTILFENSEFIGTGSIRPSMKEMDIDYLINEIGNSKSTEKEFIFSKKDLRRTNEGEICWHSAVKNAVIQLNKLNYIEFFKLKDAVSNHHIKITGSAAINLRDYSDISSKALIFNPIESEIKIRITEEKYQLLSSSNEIISEEHSKEVSNMHSYLREIKRCWGISNLPKIESYSEKVFSNKFLSSKNI